MPRKQRYACFPLVICWSRVGLTNKKGQPQWVDLEFLAPWVGFARVKAEPPSAVASRALTLAAPAVRKSVPQGSNLSICGCRFESYPGSQKHQVNPLWLAFLLVKPTRGQQMTNRNLGFPQIGSQWQGIVTYNLGGMADLHCAQCHQTATT